MPPSCRIVADGLAVALGGRRVLHGLGFAVGAGEWVGLVGPNGSGKTTLLRAVAGLLPHAGTLTFHGRPVRSWKPRELARRLAFVRQAPAVEFDFTVLDYVLLGRAPHRSWLEGFTAADRTVAETALAQVGLDGFEGRRLGEVSGGERQRVLLAQALTQEAEVVLLDEPTAHLDVHHQYDVMDRVAALVAEGRTVVAAFHDLAFAARYADRLLVLRDGRLAADGAPAEVLTPVLIHDVFRMDAEVERVHGRNGPVEIRYVAPV